MLEVGAGLGLVGLTAQSLPRSYGFVGFNKELVDVDVDRIQ